MLTLLRTLAKLFKHKHTFITRTFLYEKEETMYDEFCRCGEVRMRVEQR